MAAEQSGSRTDWSSTALANFLRPLQGRASPLQVSHWGGEAGIQSTQYSASIKRLGPLSRKLGR